MEYTRFSESRVHKWVKVAGRWLRPFTLLNLDTLGRISEEAAKRERDPERQAAGWVILSARIYSRKVGSHEHFEQLLEKEFSWWERWEMRQLLLGRLEREASALGKYIRRGVIGPPKFEPEPGSEGFAVPAVNHIRMRLEKHCHLSVEESWQYPVRAALWDYETSLEAETGKTRVMSQKDIETHEEYARRRREREMTA